MTNNRQEVLIPLHISVRCSECGNTVRIKHNFLVDRLLTVTVDLCLICSEEIAVGAAAIQLGEQIVDAGSVEPEDGSRNVVPALPSQEEPAVEGAKPEPRPPNPSHPGWWPG